MALSAATAGLQTAEGAKPAAAVDVVPDVRPHSPRPMHSSPRGAHIPRSPTHSILSGPAADNAVQCDEEEQTGRRGNVHQAPGGIEWEAAQREVESHVGPES